MSPDILKQSSDKPNAAIRKRTLVKVTVCFRYHHKTTPPLALQILYNGCSFFGGNKNILKREKARHSRNSLTVPYIRKGWTGKTVEGDQGQSVCNCHSHITVKIQEKRRVFNPSTANTLHAHDVHPAVIVQIRSSDNMTLEQSSVFHPLWLGLPQYQTLSRA